MTDFVIHVFPHASFKGNVQMLSLIEQTESLKQQFADDKAQLLQHPDSRKLEDLRVRWLGRRGKVTELYEALRTVTPADKPAAGKAINELKQLVEQTIASLRDEILQIATKQRLNSAIDISLPHTLGTEPGGRHPVTLMREVLLREFRRYGFTVYDGPELDYDYYNFSALNIPENHPSRDMQDTFFIAGQKNLLLRTHTSNIQIHRMLKEKPPLRFVAPGRVFRVDNDATHTPMFHQLEAVVVDRGISLSHLKGIVDSFLKSIYGRDLRTRFRPSYFPFVEPGAEVDLQCSICKGKGCRVCKQTGWIEIGGCGMIHPNVFEAVGYDSEEYSGFAFGFGIDRMAMMAFDLPDLRQLFEGNSYFQSQFPIFI